MKKTLILAQSLCAFRGAKPVLKDFDLEVDVGEKIAIVGPNGAGKTSFFDAICGDLPVSAGYLTVNGVNTCELSGDRLRLRQHKASIARINQNLGLVEHLDALENVMLGRLAHMHPFYSPLRFYPRSERILALECLERVGLEGFAKKLVKQMSGGQRQKVAIARALAQKAKLILADEPTAALDPAASFSIAQLLVDIANSEKITLISILHDTALIPVLSDRVVGIHSGELAFDQSSAKISHQSLRGFYDERCESARYTE